MSALIIEEDIDAPPGHARLRLQGAGAGEDARFRLLRPGAELGHLGPRGWQNEPALLTPLEVRREDAETVLVVGPAVVDQIAVDDRVRIEAPGLGFTGDDYWPDISPSSGGLASGYVDVARPIATPTSVPPWHAVKSSSTTTSPETTEPEPSAVSFASNADKTGGGLDETGDSFEANGGREPAGAFDVESDVELRAPAKLPPEAGGRRGVIPFALGGLLVVLLAVGIGLFALDPFEWFAEQPEHVAKSESDADGGHDTSPQRAVATCSNDAFAQLLADGADLAAWQEAAAGCRKAADAATYVAALDNCVAEGRAPCLFQMARCYDPRHADEIRCAPGGEPSIERAIDYYARAAEAELAAASTERATLCERLLEADPEAAFLAGCD